MAERTISVSVVDRLITEVEEKLMALRNDARLLETTIEKLEIQRDVLDSLKRMAMPEGGIVRDADGRSLTDAILATVAGHPGMTSGPVALLLNPTWGKRGDSKDFVKTVQTLIGQLVRAGRIARDDEGRLTVPVNTAG